jgi:hypothetical protein
MTTDDNSRRHCPLVTTMMEHGAEEDKAAIDMDGNKRGDFSTGLLSIHPDNAVTMMDTPPPLLTRCPGTAGVKNAAASATTVDKFGIVAHARVGRGAVTSTMDIAAWRHKP